MPTVALPTVRLPSNIVVRHTLNACGCRETLFDFDTATTAEPPVVAKGSTDTATAELIMRTDSQKDNLVVQRCSTYQTPMTVLE